MGYIKLIKSSQDHEQALARVMTLMDFDPAPDSAESDELDLLAFLIEKYEEEAFPIDSPDPIEAIKFRMEQQGLIKKRFSALFWICFKSNRGTKWHAKFKPEYDS